MMPRPKKTASRKGETPKPPANPYTFPAPIKGWWLSSNLATPEPASALVLDNWVPTTTGIRARGGKSRYATTGGAVASLMTYMAGTTERLFAATSTNIYDITTVGDATAVPSASVNGFTSGSFSTVQFGTAGGNFLYAVNGMDSAQIYDGTEWNPVTGVAVTDLPYTYASAPFEVGQSILGVTSGASASIVGITQTDDYSGVLRLGTVTLGPFVSGEDFTSATSSLAIGRNLLIRSQEFDNATWVKSATTVTANATTAPDGTMTADKLIDTAATAIHQTNQTVTVAAGATHTYSVHLKASERGFARIRVLDAATQTNGYNATVNLTTGAITAFVSGTGVLAGSAAVDSGSGWWRISITGSVPVVTSLRAYVYVQADASNISYLGDGTSGIFVWGAQIEAASAATPYEKTAAAARATMVSVATAGSTAGSAFAITGVATSALSQVWSFASRVFFVQKDTQSAWYLPVDSIGGAATEFSLSGIFGRGGSLLFGAKWSLDAGDGLDDKCVFVSTEGEIAIYEGTNPGSAADWRKVGLYQMPKPMGRKAFIQAGGDLLIATDVGLIPISAAIKTDLGAIEGAAVSRPVTPYWQTRSRQLAATEWEIIKSPRANYMVVSQPDSVDPSCLVIGLQTGAWSRFTGWDTQCMAYFDGVGYFGSADGRVYQMEVGGSDDGDLYTCAYLGQFEQMGTMGQQKTVLQARPILTQSGASSPKLTFQVDYQDTLSTPPSSAVDTASSTWDGANWDEATWDAEDAATVAVEWVSVGRTGYVVAPELQVTYGVTPTPDLALVAIDVQFSVGAIVA